MGARDQKSAVPCSSCWCWCWCHGARGCLDFPHLLEGSMKNVISCRARRCFRPTRRYCFGRLMLTFFSWKISVIFSFSFSSLRTLSSGSSIL
ncbi:hypothetical protein CSPX01_12171 [Colletotrichum filicis]|nr:hypothetical protein CSPX01_12171 [Colletotrichum filicis]